MQTGSLSRKELYDLVWSNSMVALSKKYAISDNGLRKICKRMNIPLPRNGHWMKLQFGKRVKIKPLPIDESAEQSVSLTLRSEDEKLNLYESPKKKLLLEIQNDPRLSFIVPEKLKTKEPLILAAKQRLTGKDAHHSYNYQNSVECSGGDLDIRVGVKHTGRALRFMDTLIKLLRARGHDIIIQYDSTRTVVKGQELKMKFREKFKRVIVNDRSWGNTELYPTGILAFSIEGYSGKEWKDDVDDRSDGTRRILESYLPDILVWMELKADRENIQDEIYRRQREERDRLEKIKQEFEARCEKELDDFRELLKKAKRWYKAVNIRNYIDEMERKALTGSGLTEDQNNWIQWARKKADWYDPFVEADDELMVGVDRG